MQPRGIGAGCKFDHNKPLCEFCDLPIQISGLCFNSHSKIYINCKECNMPGMPGMHEHDGKLCRVCGALLERGKCIYKCINGGEVCIHCNYDRICDDKCLHCHKEQSGQLTKAAIK
jgi:hypothetical protein